MDFFTHLLSGIVCARLLFKNSPNKQKAIILGSIAPDFDVFIAWIPNIIPELYFLAHRGFLHAIFVLPFVIPFLLYLTKYLTILNKIKRLAFNFKTLIIPVSVGTWLAGVFGSYLHLLLDLLNPQGLVLLYPLSSERFSLNTMNFLELFVSLPAVFVIFYYGNRFLKLKPIPLSKFDRYSRSIMVVFTFMVILNSSLQIHTINTQDTTVTSPGWFFHQRWIVQEQENTFNVQLVDQFSQKADYEFLYQKMVWDNSINRSQADIYILLAQKTILYQKYVFRLEPNSPIVFNVTYNRDTGFWNVIITEIINDAQFKLFGLNSDSFTGTKLVIEI